MYTGLHPVLEPGVVSILEYEYRVTHVDTQGGLV